MTPIYRPPVYGPVPTLKEHLAAQQCAVGTTSWLFRPKAHEYHYTVRLHVSDGVLVLHKDFGKFSGVRPETLGGEWCLLDLATGLPCAIGTPPETERERLERAMTAIPECMTRRPTADEVDRAEERAREAGVSALPDKLPVVARVDRGEVWVLAAALLDATERAERAEAEVAALRKVAAAGDALADAAEDCARGWTLANSTVSVEAAYNYRDTRAEVRP